MTLNIRITVKIAWWVKYYVATVNLFADTFGLIPDGEKVGRFIRKHGVKVEVA